MARSFPTDQYVNEVQNSVNQLDVHRSEQLEFTNKLLALKDKAQQAEKARLTIKYGAEYKEVKILEARLAFNQALSPAVEANISQSKTVVDPLPTNSWRVYGFVFDAVGKPVEKTTVLLLDDKNQPIQGLPTACSDARGYYALTLTGELPDSKTDLLLGAIPPGQKTPIVVSKDALHASAGIMVYREIVLAAQGCQTPSAG